MLQLLCKGAAGSHALEKLGPRMLKRDFDPGFYVEHLVKDLGIVLEEAKRKPLSSWMRYGSIILSRSHGSRWS